MNGQLPHANAYRDRMAIWRRKAEYQRRSANKYTTFQCDERKPTVTLNSGETVLVTLALVNHFPWIEKYLP